MTVLSRAPITNLDDHIDQEIAACLQIANPKSFFLLAGAGSGKTRSLVEALKHLKKEFGSRLRLRGQRIGVITYTNAACDEIMRRVDFDPLLQVSTVHSFAWNLISGLNSDIKEWLRVALHADIKKLEDEEERGRSGTRASVVRIERIRRRRERLAILDSIRSFTYSPTGENRDENALNHHEVIQISAYFLQSKELMQKIFVSQFPFLLIDEGQDTHWSIVDALLVVEEKHRRNFALGFFGDPMQQIYNEGKPGIERALPESWAKPTKRLNFRSPTRIVDLINRIRQDVDGQQQVPVPTEADACVRLFAVQADRPEKAAVEEAARSRMADFSGDSAWNDRAKCKILTLEHHMAAKRLGFESVFEPLSKVDSFYTGLLEGTLPATRFFTKTILPLVTAQRAGDKFRSAKIVRERSPLLARPLLMDAPEPQQQLRKAREGVEQLMAQLAVGDATCGAILVNIAATGLFEIPESLKPVLALMHKGSDKAGVAEEEELSERVQALRHFLEAPFSQIYLYDQYVSDASPYDTHQGVKGREFDRVMVLIDALETRGFMFDYEKLFGAKPQSATDRRNLEEGKETSQDRTKRLLYVTCSRARKSLAIVAYSSAPQAIKHTMVQNGWFHENEIVMDL